jgi:beta-aspartyl-peptidase (threonine type)
MHGLVIHGGSGVIGRASLSAELEAEYRAVLSQSLSAGFAVLSRGGEALDACIAAVMVMEDSPLFNAGKGAVLTNLGGVALDASVMVGKDASAGSVSGLKGTRNPVLAADMVRTSTPHVMLSGEEADAFFSTRLPQEKLEYFVTERRLKALREAQGEGRPPGDAAQRHGTVGAVALDSAGNLAAATSTGGMTNKAHGRVGDSPVIGAGTFADTRVAVSCTGHGEMFLRCCAAKDVAAQVEYAGRGLAESLAHTLEKVARMGGDGGIIAISKDGEVQADFNAEGMYRGWILGEGSAVKEQAIKIFR